MKTRHVLIIFIILLVLLSNVSFAFAKDLEVCYHCGGTGEFHCPSCGNAGYVNCDLCHGEGRFVCPGEDGKGPCSGGYYTCTNCEGKGYTQNYDAEGKPTDTTPCGHNNCNGTGKQECWTCHGSGWINCTRCGGSGQEECQNGDCELARNVGWKCPYCKGAGYLLTNFWPGENDGVQNVPVNGDLIWANGKSTTYGGGTSPGSGSSSESSGGGSSEGTSGGESSGEESAGSGSSTAAPYFDDKGSSIERDPSTGRDLIWNLNVGSGKWEFDGITVTLYRNGQPASGVLDIKYNELLALVSDYTGPDLHVYVNGADGSSIELGRNGDGEFCIGSRVLEGSYVPFDLTLSVELVQEEGVHEDAKLVEISFGGGSWTIDGQTVYATVNGSRMSGTTKIELFDSIKLNGFDQDTMRARVYGPNGFVADLNPSGDGTVSLENTIQANTTIPPNVSFAIEKRDDVTEDNAGSMSEAVQYDPKDLEGADREVFDKLSEEELRSIIREVEKIVGSARLGHGDGAILEKLAKISLENNVGSDGGDAFFPIQFDGHIDIGFPIKITVRAQPGDLDASKTIYMYHIREGGVVEYLGVAETTKHEDGSVDELSFYTRSFSDFFASYIELEKGIEDATSAKVDDKPQEEEKCGTSEFPMIAIAVVIIVIVILAGVLKKKKQS